MPVVLRVLPAALFLVGCAGPATLTGDVGGQAVPEPLDAVFGMATVSLPGEPEVTVFSVIVSDVRESCELLTALSPEFEGGACADDCERLGDVAENLLEQDDPYGLFVTLSVDPASPEGSVGVGDGAAASFVQWDMSRLFDPEACAAECATKGTPFDATTTEATSGTVDITRYDFVEDELDGSLDLQLDGGSLSGTFESEMCGTMGRP